MKAVKRYIKDNLGILIALVLMVAFLCVYPRTSGTFPTVKNIFNVLRQSAPNLMLACGMTMVIILGGIYSGLFTPTEAAAVAVVYGLIIGVFVYKTVKPKDLYRIFIDSASTTATIMGSPSGTLITTTVSPRVKA